MHEQSLVNSLWKQAESIRQQHGATCVTEMSVEIGPLSGVEPLLLQSAFQRTSSNYSPVPTKLVIHQVPLLARCQPCDFEFEVTQFDFHCPRCQGTIQVTHGEKIVLVDVTLGDGQ